MEYTVFLGLVKHLIINKVHRLVIRRDLANSADRSQESDTSVLDSQKRVYLHKLVGQVALFSLNFCFLHVLSVEVLADRSEHDILGQTLRQAVPGNSVVGVAHERMQENIVGLNAGFGSFG